MGRTARRALVAVAAAALLAAGCSSRTFEQVGGIVLDARTREPVARGRGESHGARRRAVDRDH
jgi:type IV pilus biogenesis protein CpaD/CtpE